MRRKKQDIGKELAFFERMEFINYYDSVSKEAFNIILDEVGKFKFGGLVLEAGCATGSLGKELLKFCSDMTMIGVDINQKFVEKIKQAKDTRYEAIRGNLEDPKLFEREKFDCIIFINILHHFPNIDKVFDNAYYWLKKNGMILIFDPNGSNLILKISYYLRVLLYKFFPEIVSGYASVNERSITVEDFIKSLNKFFVILRMRSILNDTGTRFTGGIIRFLASVRLILFRLYNFWPNLYSGSDLLIIAKKRATPL